MRAARPPVFLRVAVCAASVFLGRPVAVSGRRDIVVVDDQFFVGVALVVIAPLLLLKLLGFGGATPIRS